jgi:hypothetical protein
MNQSKTSAETLPPLRDQTTSPTLGQSGVGKASPKNSHAKAGGTFAGNAFLEMTARLISDSSRLVQAQLSLWNDHLTLCQRSTQRFLGGATEPVVEPSAGDRRFRDVAWTDNTLFDFIKQSYLLKARWLQNAVRDVQSIDQHTARRIDFYTGQFVDGIAPSNFLITNPEVLRETITYFVTMVDFADAGELSVFIDEEQPSALEERMNAKGSLEGRDMSAAFKMLRANDFIWSCVVNNYLLGRSPFSFDLLYWNADSTHLPAAMHSFYLRNMYHENLLAKPGGISLDGVPIDLRKIRTPSFLLSTREDHVAPWRSTYAAPQLYRGPVKFVLSASGHIAGVVNPPGGKYGHWENEKNPPTPEEWLATATSQPDSWWPTWESWISQYAGGEVPARHPGDGRLKPIEDSPGSYVKVRAAG